MTDYIEKADRYGRPYTRIITKDGLYVDVIYEDNHLIAAVKPAGVLSQPDGSDRPEILEIIKKYIAKKYAKPGDVYLGSLHRLDLPVSGVMLFARTSKAASRISAQIREGEMEKRYIVCVKGKIEKTEGRLTDKIKKVEGKRAVSDETGKSSSLFYKVIAYDEKHDVSLLDIDLETGRIHQIRFMFSGIGHPVFGDKKYGTAHNITKGNNEKEEYSIAMFSYFIRVTHPTTKESLCIKGYPEKQIFPFFLKEIDDYITRCNLNDRRLDNA